MKCPESALKSQTHVDSVGACSRGKCRNAVSDGSGLPVSLEGGTIPVHENPLSAFCFLFLFCGNFTDRLSFLGSGTWTSLVF